MGMIELSRIFIYPIKSTPGIELSAAKLLERGLEHDRRFMLVDRNGNLITARLHPKLFKLGLKLADQNLIVNAQQMPDLHLPLEPLEVIDSHRQVRVWFDWMLGLDMGRHAANWFSDFLGVEVQLVWMPERSERRMNPAFGTSRLSFADGNQIHLINQASITDLESRVGAAVGVERFRPNLLVRGAEPYAEDTWNALHFDGLELRLHEACARCMIVNLESRSGKIGLEPLRTLVKYRRVGKKVLFGQHLHALESGMLKVGDRAQAM
jgi:uncharacterized protein